MDSDVKVDEWSGARLPVQHCNVVQRVFVHASGVQQGTGIMDRERQQGGISRWLVPLKAVRHNNGCKVLPLLNYR